MKKTIAILIGLLMLLSAADRATAALLDFEDLCGTDPPGQDVLTGQYISSGVVFSNAETNILAWSLSSDWNNTIGIRADDIQTSAPHKMTFSVPVQQVSIGYIGNYGTGYYGHEVYLELYDDNDVMIGSDYAVIAPYTDNPDPMVSLAATAMEDVAYALFGGKYGFGDWNSLYYDNITFIPEPATILLLGLGFLGLLYKRRV